MHDTGTTLQPYYYILHFPAATPSSSLPLSADIPGQRKKRKDAVCLNGSTSSSKLTGHDGPRINITRGNPHERIGWVLFTPYLAQTPYKTVSAMFHQLSFARQATPGETAAFISLLEHPSWTLALRHGLRYRSAHVSRPITNKGSRETWMEMSGILGGLLYDDDGKICVWSRKHLERDVFLEQMAHLMEKFVLMGAKACSVRPT